MTVVGKWKTLTVRGAIATETEVHEAGSVVENEAAIEVTAGMQATAAQGAGSVAAAASTTLEMAVAAGNEAVSVVIPEATEAVTMRSLDSHKLIVPAILRGTVGTGAMDTVTTVAEIAPARIDQKAAAPEARPPRQALVRDHEPVQGVGQVHVLVEVLASGRHLPLKAGRRWSEHRHSMLRQRWLDGTTRRLATIVTVVVMTQSLLFRSTT